MWSIPGEARRITSRARVSKQSRHEETHNLRRSCGYNIMQVSERSMTPIHLSRHSRVELLSPDSNENNAYSESRNAKPKPRGKKRSGQNQIRGIRSKNLSLGHLFSRLSQHWRNVQSEGRIVGTFNELLYQIYNILFHYTLFYIRFTPHEHGN